MTHSVPASSGPSDPLSDAIQLALSTLPATHTRLTDDGQIEVELQLSVKVTGPRNATFAFSDDPKMLEDITVADAMGPICCRCVKWQNGSWLCHGTCC